MVGKRHPLEDDSAVYAGTLNLLLARMAVERGLVTQEQVRAAEIEQDSERHQGVSPVRTLGVILVEQGALTNAQLVALLKHLRDRNGSTNGDGRKETRLGTLLLQRNSITPPQLAECLRVQAEARRRDETVVPRLGEILVHRGFAPAAVVNEILAAQAEARTAV